MADRKPDKGISSTRAFDVNTFASQAGYEKRRLGQEDLSVLTI